MRTLATHQCGLDSNSGVNGHNYVGRVCCWFSPLHREVFRVLQFFLSPQKSTLPNSNLVRKVRTPLKEFLRSPKCVAGKQLQHLTSQRTPVCRLCPGKEEVVALIICGKMKLASPSTLFPHSALLRGEVVTSCCHGSKIFGRQQTVNVTIPLKRRMKR